MSAAKKINSKQSNEDTARLMQAISALSSAPETITARGRLLDPTKTSRTGLLDLILAEIDETVLRRLLNFENENGNHLILEVAERRIMRIFRHQSEIEGNAKETGQPVLTSADASSTVSVLQEFCGKSDAIYVVSHIPTHSMDQDFGGVSCAELHRSEKIAPDFAKGPQEVQTALRPLISHASAIVVIIKEGQEHLVWGDANDIDSLLDVARESDQPTQVCEFQLWSEGTDQAQHVGCLTFADAEVWFMRNGGSWDFCYQLHKEIFQNIR